MLAAPLMLAGVMTGLQEAPASALTCQAWTGVQPPSPGQVNELAGVAVVSACNIWAVGWFTSDASGSAKDQTLIEHWDGSSWAVVPGPDLGSGPRGSQLTSVRAVSASDVWAVGVESHGQTLTEHWDGTAWTRVPSPSPGAGNFLAGVTATSARTAFAVGSAGFRQPLVLQWNGSSWSQAASPPEGAGNALEAVGAGAAGNVWAVGSSSDATKAYAAPLLGTAGRT
jgi:hypothetical protein